MPKVSRRRKKLKKSGNEPIPWLPIDSRILPDIIRFGHVKGVARVFLIIEMALAFTVVLATFIMAFLKLTGFVL